MPKRPALVRRLPPVFGTIPSRPIVEPENRAKFPDLEDDFRFLDTELIPAFRAYDEAALRAQSRFRKQQLTLIVGGAVSAILGALNASLPSGWMRDTAAFVEALLAGILALTVALTRRSPAQQRYLSTRLHAEKLRGEYFRFVVRAGEYADEAGRATALKQRVTDLSEELEA